MRPVRINIFAILLFLFVCIPFIELILLFRIGRIIGLAETFLVIIVTGIVGAALARSQGLSVVSDIRRRLRAGELPADSLLDGLFIFCAALLLVTPGFLTDVVGFAFLVPPLRKIFRTVGAKYLKRNFQSSVNFGDTSEFKAWSRGDNTSDVIDVEGKEVDDYSNDDRSSS